MARRPTGTRDQARKRQAYDAATKIKDQIAGCPRTRTGLGDCGTCGARSGASCALVTR